jgi:2-(1,2-epoxy-1,2-dihydrophenyl)acetyl-CoA isomerase
MSNHDLVLVKHEGPCRWLFLNRSDKLNAVSRALASELRAALQNAVEDPDCRVVVLTGTGRAFSAGQDLEERRDVATKPIDLGAELAANWHPLIKLVHSTDKPIVASVNGLASGAAANLVLACDIVLAARSASFTQPFVRIGIMPDCGGIYTLPRLVGSARARAMALLASPVNAERAEQLGLIWRVVADDELESETRGVVERLLQAAPLALAATKRALRDSQGLDLEAVLALEAAQQQQLGQSRDYVEGVKAFFDKRSPAFCGR